MTNEIDAFILTMFPKPGTVQHAHTVRYNILTKFPDADIDAAIKRLKLRQFKSENTWWVAN